MVGLNLSFLTGQNPIIFLGLAVAILLSLILLAGSDFLLGIRKKLSPGLIKVRVLDSTGNIIESWRKRPKDGAWTDNNLKFIPNPKKRLICNGKTEYTFSTKDTEPIDFFNIEHQTTSDPGVLDALIQRAFARGYLKAVTKDNLMLYLTVGAVVLAGVAAFYSINTCNYIPGCAK